MWFCELFSSLVTGSVRLLLLWALHPWCGHVWAPLRRLIPRISILMVVPCLRHKLLATSTRSWAMLRRLIPDSLYLSMTCLSRLCSLRLDISYLRPLLTSQHSNCNRLSPVRECQWRMLTLRQTTTALTRHRKVGTFFCTSVAIWLYKVLSLIFCLFYRNCHCWFYAS